MQNNSRRDEISMKSYINKQFVYFGIIGSQEGFAASLKNTNITSEFICRLESLFVQLKRISFSQSLAFSNNMFTNFENSDYIKVMAIRPRKWVKLLSTIWPYHSSPRNIVASELAIAMQNSNRCGRTWSFPLQSRSGAQSVSRARWSTRRSILRCAATQEQSYHSVSKYKNRR